MDTNSVAAEKAAMC